MNFEKLRNYNTVVLSLIFTLCLLALLVFLVIMTFVESESENSVFRRSRVKEVPEPNLSTFFPDQPTLLDNNKKLFMLPQASIPQEITADEDSISGFIVKAEGDVVHPMLDHLISSKSLADEIQILNGKTITFSNILPPGLLAHSVTLIYDGSANWLCFLARPKKGLQKDDLYMYSTANASLHRIGKPGYCPAELHFWKNQGTWLLSMAKDLNNDGFIQYHSEPREWMAYNSETQQLLPVE